uniref:CBM21 domain-containing protein n=1 Tax=Scophthalmus maximus TaxID=52904 RepID=A0A8D3BE01_SCOMX
MEALCVQPVKEDGVMTEEEEQGKSGEEGEMEATFPAGCTTDEDTDEDSEPEPPPVVRRKVSFADAFGLNLVSVKEFDNVEVTESEVSQPPEREAAYPLLPSPSHEFYMCCLFTIPSSPEELDQRLQVQKVELESIELLPGTTTLRGTVRVLNLCYGKAVYARISLDGWSSYFDLLAEYVPGSSDRKTDRFTFKYALIPPFGREGTRVDFCLRYETLAGTFWANNKEMNYVLFCHQKGQVKGPGPQVLEESTTYRGKRSCLKANRRVSAEEKTTETIHTSTVSAGAQATHEAEQADRKTLDSREMESLLLLHEGHQPLVDGVRSWPRGTRVARVQDFASRVRQAPGAYSHVSATGQKASRPMPAPRTHSDRYNWRKKPSDSPQVLTYHQIPLLTLDWQNEKPRPRGAADVDDIWIGSAKPSGSEASEENTHSPSVNDLWETFPNGTDDTVDKETSVCDVWQKFLKEPSSKDHSGLPESEWLQTAASVSPSNHSGPQTRYMASSPAFQGRQAGTSAPTTLHAHTSRARQLLSDECGALLSNGALSAGDHQPAEACVSGPSGENTATHDASQRSQTNSATDTSQEFSLKGATPVAGGSVDSAAECHEAAIWGREGIVGEAKGTGGDQRAALHTADLVTSSGESKATDMTAMPESQNASTVDRISQGARQDEGLSSSGEGEVTGTTHNAMDDTLAFRETIRRGTKDGPRSAFSTARQRAEGRIMTNSTENKASTEEEIFRPHKTEECEISQRRADEKHCEEVRLNRKSENPLLESERDENEIRPAQSHAHGSNPNQTCEGNITPSPVMESEFKTDESEKDMASSDKDLEGFRRTQVENSSCKETKDTKRLISAESEMIISEEEDCNDKPVRLNSSVCLRGDTSIVSEVHNKQSRPVQAHVKNEEEASTFTQIEENVLKYETGEYVFDSNQTEGGESLSCSGIIVAQQEIDPSPQSARTMELREKTELFHSHHDTLRPFPADKCNPNPMEVVEARLESSQDVVKGQKEGAGGEISPGEVTVEESVTRRDTTETIGRIEADLSRRDKDESPSIGRLKTEAAGELMGPVEDPRAEGEDSSAELKERELSAGVDGSRRVECRKLSGGTKGRTAPENAAALGATRSRVAEALTERFGEDLVRGIWEEVFGRKVQDIDRDVVGGMRCGAADVTGVTRDCHLLFEKADNSGTFSLADPRFYQGPKQTTVTNGKEHSPKGAGQSLDTTDQSHPLSELQADLNPSAHLSQDLTATLAALSRKSSTESAQTISSPRDEGNYTQIRKRSATRQETGRQIEDCVAAYKENLNRSSPPFRKHPLSSAEELKESHGLGWWSIYMLTHVIRLLTCTLLVAGFFVVVYLYDFPAFFALYMFSVCWWFYKWRSYRATMNKGAGREFAGKRDGVKECSV